MALSHIIAHRIGRENPSAPTTIKLRDNCWQTNGRIDECFRELKLCFIKRLGKDYGRFSDDHASHPLSSWLKEFTDEKMSFESVTKKAMEHLKSELDKTEELIDGFFVFAHEQQEAGDSIHIFFAEHNSGQFIDGDMELSDSLYLDTNGIRLAAKISLTDWLSGDAHREANTLTLLRWRGEKGLSDAFHAFIGFAEKRDLSAETEEFLDVVSDYTKDLPDDVAQHTKAQVVHYCLEQDKAGKPVVISELSSQLKNNPAPTKPSTNTDSEAPTKPRPPMPEFSNFVSQKKPAAKPELIPDKAQLRQFVRISGRNEQLSMSFASSLLGDSIVYDPETDSLTIKNIPPALKTRLAKYAQENPTEDNTKQESAD